MLQYELGPKTKDYKQGEVGGVLKAMGYATEQVWKFWGLGRGTG